MTCVVAWSDDRRVVVAADSTGSSLEKPGEMHTIAIPKVFKIGGWVIAFCGSWLVGQVARYHVRWPEPPAETGDLYRFVLGEIVPEIRRALDQAGHDRAQPGPWQVLMARDARILTLSSRWDLLEPAAPYVAIGAGRFVAYGALHAWAQRHDLTLEEKVERVLEAVCHFVPGIRGPFVFEST